MTRMQKMKLATAVTAGAVLSAPASTLLSVPAAAQSYYAAPRVRLNGQPLATSVAPQVRNGRTLVPMRDIFEALGATVVWNPNTQAIRAQKDATEIWLQIGNRTARVNRQARTLDEAPALYDGSTLVPLRFVSEALGADVNWNNATRIVAIRTDGRVADGRGVRDRDTRDRGPRRTAVRDNITIPAGAVVPVTLDRTLSSATARVGDTFNATVKSEQEGDSEFPAGTKLRGRVTEVHRLEGNNPGVLGLEFTQVLLPEGGTVAIRGELISLDNDSVTQTNGRIMARDNGGNNDTIKAVGIGAAAGYVLGRVIDKNSLITAILGAAGGYLYDRNRDKNRAQEAVIESGSTLGVRLAQSVTYADTSGYLQRRRLHLR